MAKQKERREDREADLREALDVATQHFRRGRAEEAMEVYRRVLALDPENFEAMAGIGDLLLSRGRPGDAIMAYGGALRARPEGSVEVFINRGSALIQANDLEAAATSFRRALDLEPDNITALNNLGSAYAQSGQPGEALELFRRAQRVAPDHPAGHFNAALALAAQDPAGNAEEVIAAYRAAIACDPKFAPACLNLAQCLAARGETAEALELVDEAELQAPKDLPVLIGKGQIYEAMGEYGNAAAVFDRAVLLHPDDVDARLALARAALAAGKMKKAVSTCFDLLASHPDLPQAKLMLAHALIEDGKVTRAKETLEEVDELPGARRLLQHLALADGEADAWATLAARSPAEDRSGGLATWDGAPTGADLLIDGRGVDPEDIILFARLLPEAAARAGRVVLCHDRILGPLLEGVPGLASVLPADEPLPPGLSLRLPYAALPAALGHRGRSLPANVPYLHPQAGRAREWDPAMFVANEPVVGICWQDRGRAVGPDQDLTFRELEPLFEEIPARFLSLTYRNGRNDAGLMEDFGVIEAAAQCRDLEDVLAAIERMDLVITTDGLIPHLAGAMGKECWLLLPVFPDWRWGRRGLSCPFYPSLRVFRAERTGDWASLIADVQAELAGRTAA
ncbi:MAG: tetratricopeptide repeat protein [Sneathiellaceae bacterium]